MAKSLSELALAAKAAQEARLEADRVAKGLKSEEDKLFGELQLAMMAAGLSYFHIPSVEVKIEEKVKPYISDFGQLEGYIKEHGALDLLQKRLTESAVKLRWDDGIQIPGVGVLTEQKLKLK